jgi:hypothetical protein
MKYATCSVWRTRLADELGGDTQVLRCIRYFLHELFRPAGGLAQPQTLAWGQTLVPLDVRRPGRSQRSQQGLQFVERCGATWRT